MCSFYNLCFINFIWNEHGDNDDQLHEKCSSIVQHVYQLSSNVDRVNASLRICDVMTTATAETAVMKPTAVS